MNKKPLFNRCFLIVLDSFGVGELPDAARFNDVGSDTLRAVTESGILNIPNLKKLGLYNVNGVYGREKLAVNSPAASYAKMAEKSAGKDTTVGHFEIAGVISKSPFPTYPNGFPKDIIDEFSRKTGKKILCNKPYSGTEVIKDYGEEQIKTGGLIVYTSADSVFQIAAHESVVGVSELYKYSELAREMLTGKNNVARVIARPFAGDYPFYRTANRHDFSVTPPKKTMLDYLKESGFSVIGIGKINDIFAAQGITETTKTSGNADGMRVISEYVKKDFNGLCFLNLVDFDMLYGHRNDVSGYANALNEFDKFLGEFLTELKRGDALIITADHGCDPSTPSTDHSREYTPMLIIGGGLKSGVNLGVLPTFADVGATVLDGFDLPFKALDGVSFLDKIKG